MSNQAFEFRHDSHLETALGTVRPFEQPYSAVSIDVCFG